MLLVPRMLRRQWLVALALAGFAGPAGAQVFTNISRSGSPRTLDPGGVQGSLNTTSPIGRRDCEGEEWTFTINYAANPAGMTTTSLQYFIGADAMACTMANARAPVTSGTARCWPIRQTPSLTFTNPTTPLSYTVRIRSQYLVDPEGGNCVTPGTTQGTSNTNYLSVLAFPPSDSNVIGTYAISYDVTPPDAPTDVVASPGEGAAIVSWNYPGSLSTSDDGGTTTAAPPDLQGYWLLCDPPVGTTSSADGGVADATAVLDGDDEEDDETGGTCGSSTLANLDVNDSATFARYRCSDLVGATATRAVAQGLDNGRAYRMAVVAQDLAGNRSIASVSGNCVTPVPVTDFWEAYRAAGGRAQPGACGVGAGRLGAGGGWIVLAVGVALWSRRRRTR
ncbi:MAG: hypothetical protein JWM10_4873 [Myxococcaceae bacterium]|nr:hypothetical protein [Myxococcaceae bacterium]